MFEILWGSKEIKTPSVPLFRGKRVDGRFASLRKEAKGYVHFLGARKRNQKNIHPYPSSPYMERLKLRTAETDSSECVLVSRDDAMGF